MFVLFCSKWKVEMKIEASSREREKCSSFKERDTTVSLEKSTYGKFSVETQRERETKDRGRWGQNEWCSRYRRKKKKE